MLSSGDKITLGVSPPIAVDTYHNLKPIAIITRTIGEDMVREVEDMREDLKRLFADALATEIEVYLGAHQVLGGAKDVEALYQDCLRKAGRAKDPTPKVETTTKARHGPRKAGD